MSNYQRMIAVPQEEYLQLTAVQNARQPLTQQFYNVEKQYNENENIRDPYRRLAFQSDNLEQLKGLKEQMRNYISISTPKPYRNRAQALLQSIEAFIRYNERGEIYDNDCKVIEHSCLEDLIQHAVRDRRRNMIPIEWNCFIKELQSQNVPKSLFNRATLDEIEKPSLMKVSFKKEEEDDEGVTLRVKAKAKKRKISDIKKSKQYPKRERKPSVKLLDYLSEY